MKPASESLQKFFENPQVREKVRLLTPDQLLALVKKFPRDEQEAVAEILEELRTRTMREMAQEDFMSFVKEACPRSSGVGTTKGWPRRSRKWPGGSVNA